MYLTKNQSDHTPIFLNSNGFSVNNPLNRPFDSKQLGSYMRNFKLSWLKIGRVVRTYLRHSQVWPSIFSPRIRMCGDRLWKRIEGVQKKLCSDTSRGLLILEKKLREELDVVLDLIHMFWVEKARTDVLRDGDEIWFDEPNQLRLMVSNHFA
ncbi:hypothetical protein V2J09_019446 [Rumex salicifolius]